MGTINDNTMIKAVFLDIDGTLVSFKTHSIPQSTLKALAQLHKQGVKLFISTGRPEVLMRKAINNFPFDGYITLNGAYCFTASHHVIYKGSIPPDDIEHLISFHQQRPDIPFVFVHDDTWFITSVNETVQKVADLIQISLPPISPIEEARGKEILQIMGYFQKDEDIEVFSQVLKHCEPMRWNPLFADIIARGNSKSHGIDHIIRYYGIDLQETMAFGDGGNDIPMLKHAGIGIAMGNATPEVQKASDFVTTTVDEDGILHALKHFGLL